MQLEGILELINPKVPAFVKAAPDHNANPTGYQFRASSSKTKKCITYEIKLMKEGTRKYLKSSLALLGI